MLFNIVALVQLAGEEEVDDDDWFSLRAASAHPLGLSAHARAIRMHTNASSLDAHAPRCAALSRRRFVAIGSATSVQPSSLLDFVLVLEQLGAS